METGYLVWIPIVGMITTFGMVIAIVWLLTRARQRNVQSRSEVQMRMIEKFGTSAEFTQFLSSPAGREFLEPRRSARDRVLVGVRAGVILVFLGVAFFLGYFAEHDRGFFIPAFILGGLGLGFLVSSAISWSLVKRWEGTQQQQSLP